MQEVQEEKKVRSIGTIGMRVFVLLLVLMLSFGLGACGEKETPSTTEAVEEEGTSAEVIHFTIDASRYFESDKAMLSKDDVGADEQGFIYNKDVPVNSEKNIIDYLFDTEVPYEAAGGYVSEIGGIRGGLTGDMSGWLYTVNGEMPSVGPDQYTLKPGDEVRFIYSNDGGADAGFSWE